jgi:hypothetical protein
MAVVSDLSKDGGQELDAGENQRGISLSQDVCQALVDPVKVPSQICHVRIIDPDSMPVEPSGVRAADGTRISLDFRRGPDGHALLHSLRHVGQLQIMDMLP